MEQTATEREATLEPVMTIRGTKARLKDFPCGGSGTSEEGKLWRESYDWHSEREASFFRSILAPCDGFFARLSAKYAAAASQNLRSRVLTTVEDRVPPTVVPGN
jgi:hypothetical protein